MQNTLKGWAKAFEIFAKHEVKESHVATDHDVVWVGFDCKNPMSDEEIALLDELGWCWDSDVQAFRKFV